MKLKEAIESINAPKGMTTMIDGIMSGDWDSIRPPNMPTTIESAKAELQKAQKAQAECKSDAAYWGYAGNISYWKAIVNIFKAAEITGADNLPDIPKPKQGIVVMDCCSIVEKFGEDLLQAAKND